MTRTERQINAELRDAEERLRTLRAAVVNPVVRREVERAVESLRRVELAFALDMGDAVREEAKAMGRV